MARAKSAVLTPADKKAVVIDIKVKISSAKNELKSFMSVVKESEKNLKAAEKQHAVVVKTANKEIAYHEKTLSKLMGDLSAIQPAAVK